MEEIDITDVLDLHSFSPKDVKAVVEEYLYQCVQRGFRMARIIHGKGAGIQRQIVRSVLSRSDFVARVEDGPNWGSTVVHFVESR